MMSEQQCEHCSQALERIWLILSADLCTESLHAIQLHHQTNNPSSRAVLHRPSPLLPSGRKSTPVLLAQSNQQVSNKIIKENEI